MRGDSSVVAAAAGLDSPNPVSWLADNRKQGAAGLPVTYLSVRQEGVCTMLAHRLRPRASLATGSCVSIRLNALAPYPLKGMSVPKI